MLRLKVKPRYFLDLDDSKDAELVLAWTQGGKVPLRARNRQHRRQCAFLSSAGRAASTHRRGPGWQAMPIFEQAIPVSSRRHRVQPSVQARHAANPTPDWMEGSMVPSDGACGVVGASAAVAIINAAAALAKTLIP
jgi:hypothetical protein